jgi:hypothetical protein
MKKALIGIALLISGAFIIDGCKKPDPVVPPGTGGTTGGTTVICYPKTITTSGTSLPDSIEYIRDSKNRVTKENHYNSTGSLASYVVYTYNTAGYITKADSFDNTGTSLSYYSFDQSTTSVTKKHFVYETGAFVEKDRAVYSLGPNRRPTKAVYYQISSNVPILVGSLEFPAADTKGNINSAKIYNETGAQAGNITYTYDANKNYRVNLPEMDFTAITKSSHNIIGFSYKDMQNLPVTSYTVDYTYTSNNYPKSVHDSHNQGQFVTYDCK